MDNHNSSRSICFVFPRDTASVSVTGGRCALNCAHCGGHYLKHMMPIGSAVHAVKKKSIKSCLVSGGCDGSGKVPILQYSSILDELKREGIRLNVHAGLLQKEEIDGLVPYADAVSFDFVVDGSTIREVYRLDRDGGDYIESYKAIKKCVPVIPHITIGLHGGEIRGEYEALQALSGIGADALVFLVFIPTPGTAFGDRQPPAISEVVRLLSRARSDFPGIPIHLGCMRPGGEYRRELDALALRCGLDKIVMPDKGTVRDAERSGMKITIEKECCAL